MTSDDAKRFIDLFKPNPDQRGYYSGQLVQDPQKEGKLVSRTDKMIVNFGRGCIFESWSVDHVLEHLNGAHRFGLFPLFVSGLINFAALDIDEYSGFNHQTTAVKLQRICPQSILVRSKSGGAHIFWLFSEPMQASEVRVKITEFRAAMGLTEQAKEIFPKQNNLSDGSKGNWINAPYFNAENTTQYAFGKEGEALTFTEFLDEAEKRKITPEQLKAFRFAKASIYFHEGPPCLEQIWQEGVPVGGRNIALYNAGKYLALQNKEQLPFRLAELNQKMPQPLEDSEVQAILKSLRKAKPGYSCKDFPLKPACNSCLCRTRKYGVNKATTFPTMVGITIFKSTPPMWHIHFEDGRKVTCQSEEFLNPNFFRLCCLNQLYELVPMLSHREWSELISELLTNAAKEEVDVPDDVTEKGIMWSFICEFLTSKGTGNDIQELEQHRPVFMNRFYYFVMKDLYTWMMRKTHTYRLDSSKVQNLLHEMKVCHTTKKVGEKQMSVYMVPMDIVISQQVSFPDPVPNKSTPY